MRLKGNCRAECRVIDDPAEIERLRWFQIRRYVESGIADLVPASLDDDPYVERSTYFGVYGPDGQIWGTSRFISAPNVELPIFRDFDVNPEFREMLDAHDSEVSEVSRLTVAQDAPRAEAFSVMVREMLKHTVQTQRHTISIGSVERPLIRIIKRTLQMPCDVIGPPLHDYYNTTNYPVMIDTIRYLADLRYRDLENWQYFTQDLVIDLREPRRAPLVPSSATEADRV